MSLNNLWLSIDELLIIISVRIEKIIDKNKNLLLDTLSPKRKFSRLVIKKHEKDMDKIAKEIALDTINRFRNEIWEKWWDLKWIWSFEDHILWLCIHWNNNFFINYVIYIDNLNHEERIAAENLARKWIIKIRRNRKWHMMIIPIIFEHNK